MSLDSRGFVGGGSRRVAPLDPSGCGCDENPCEHSRWRDGYELCVLDTLPASHVPSEPGGELGPGEAPDCPVPPADPWVVVAKVTVDKDGKADFVLEVKEGA